MGTAILLGIPKDYFGRLRHLLEDQDWLWGWSVKYVAAPGKTPEIIPRQVASALALAAQNDDAHVIGFSYQQNRQEIARQIRPYFRFRWFDASLLRCIANQIEAFLGPFRAALEEESEWTLKIKPDMASPLLLPECSFRASKQVVGLWRQAEAFGDVQNIPNAERIIEQFRQAHHQRVTGTGHFPSEYCWVDERQCRYDRTGERHGEAPFPRCWKYSYPIEPGFHFDVTSLGQKAFEIVDAAGKNHRIAAAKHINIDPHGIVRG